MKLLLALALTACASAPAHVAAPVAPTNYALNFARASFPTGDSIALGDHTAIVRDGLVLAMCVETDAAHHTQCVAIKDFTPPKPPEAPITPVHADAAKAEAAPPAKTEAPKKK